MYTRVSLDQIRDVSYAIERDKENLFSLADKVIAVAPLRQWGVWIADATSSYFLAQFLGDVYTASDKVEGGPPPIVHIANSRPVRGDGYHQQVVATRLGQPELAIAGRNALILCEYTKDRYALSTLCKPLRRLGAVAVDAAVLNLDYPGRYAQPSDAPDTIYRGEPGIYEPELFMGILKDAVGQESVCGVAEPQDRTSADLVLRAYVSRAFGALAQEYTASRQS